MACAATVGRVISAEPLPLRGKVPVMAVLPPPDAALPQPAGSAGVTMAAWALQASAAAAVAIRRTVRAGIDVPHVKRSVTYLIPSVCSMGTEPSLRTGLDKDNNHEAPVLRRQLAAA
ncbi:MAG TPA: hypothetical protein PLH50_06995 [Ottowia beijingensis]|nr:hypothetical protein [Ottowia beijingensis]